jgi:DNA-binding MarR family transcriptional regulator
MGDELALRNQVCFALYSASRAVTAVYRPILEPLGLTYPQYLVLLVLWEHERAVTVKELGDELMLDSGTLSPLLKRMASAGLVTKQRSTTDERSVLVHLTPAGRALRERATGVPAKVAAATGLAPAHLRTLRTTLREMAGAAQATAAALPQS